MSQQFFCGEMSPRACSGALARCTGMARRRGQRTLRGNIKRHCAVARAACVRVRARSGARVLQVLRCSAAQHEGAPCRQRPASQRSLHNAPIFRLLLKVAVNGTHQCGFFNFCGALWAPTVLRAGARSPLASRLRASHPFNHPPTHQQASQPASQPDARPPLQPPTH